MKYVFNLFRPYFSRDWQTGMFVVIMHIVQHTSEEYVITIISIIILIIKDYLLCKLNKLNKLY